MTPKFLVVFALLIQGCSSSAIGEGAQSGVINNCAGRPELDGLHVYVLHSGIADEFSFDKSGMRRVAIKEESKVPYPKIRNDTGRNDVGHVERIFPNIPPRLPNGDKLGFPADGSSGGRWAASVLRNGHESPTDLVVSNGREIKRISVPSGFAITTLAWNSDSSSLAVIEYSSQTAVKSVLDFISPHPVPYSDIVLAAYRPSGEFICRAALNLNARYAYAWIAWE